MERRDLTVMAAIAALVALAAVLHFAAAAPLLAFAAAALALGGIAHLIGEATDQLGNHLSPAATGIVQSAVGNLPELFVCIFALRAGLVTVVQASLIGSILSNALLVLGLAFLAGGWRHGCCASGPHAADDRDAAHARGRRAGAADAGAPPAPAGQRARAGAVGGLRRWCCCSSSPS